MSRSASHHPSFVERVASRLGCVTENQDNLPLFGPLWRYEPACSVTQKDPTGTMFEVLKTRAELIMKQAPTGMEYYGAILADATIQTALYAETVPNCTLCDIYRAGKEPEAMEENAIFSVEKTCAFESDFISAISLMPGKTKSPSARFLSKGILDNLSSVRYVSTQLFKILQGGTKAERDLIECLVSLAILGAFPHCRVVAPIPIRIWLYRNPSAAVLQVAEKVKSKILWLMLVEFISGAIDRHPLLDRALYRTTQHETKPAFRFKLVNNDLKLRGDVFNLIDYHIFGGRGGKAPKSGRYNVTAEKVRCVPVSSPYENAIAAHGIKRKLSTKIINETTEAGGFFRLYRSVVNRAPWGRYIDLDVMDSLGVPTTPTGRALYLHAVEQRSVGLSLVPTLEVVEKTQRRALSKAGLHPTVEVCTRCNSLRETPAGTKPNKATGGTLLCLKSGNRTCANCGSDAIVDIDPCGFYFLWLSRHIDKDRKVATVCSFCGRFATPVAIRGNLPICKGCVAVEPTLENRSVLKCGICDSKLHRKSARMQVLSVNDRAIDGCSKKSLVCHTCSVLEHPLRIWNLKAMRDHLGKDRRSRR